MPPVDARRSHGRAVLTALLNPAVVDRRRLDGPPGRPMAEAAGGRVCRGAGRARCSSILPCHVGMPGVAGVGRAAAGVFVAEFVFGLAWAALAYRFWPASDERPDAHHRSARLADRHRAAWSGRFGVGLRAPCSSSSACSRWDLAPLPLVMIGLARALERALARTPPRPIWPRPGLSSVAVVQRARPRRASPPRGAWTRVKRLLQQHHPAHVAGCGVMAKPALRANRACVSLLASVSPTKRRTPAAARSTQLAEQQARQPSPCQGSATETANSAIVRSWPAHVARLGDNRLAPIDEHLGDQRQMVGVVDLREALHELLAAGCASGS